MFSYNTLAWLVSIALVLLLILITWRRCSRRNPLDILPGPSPYPIIGNIFEMVQIEAVDLFLQWAKMYGKILKYKVFLLG